MKVPAITPSAHLAESAMGRLSFRELAVDFFGSLVPGMVFVLIAAATLAWSFAATLLAFTLGVSPRYDGQLGVVAALGQIRTLVEPFTLEILIVVVLLSYVVGHTFYRQDPKEADRRSFERLYPRRRRASPQEHARIRAELEGWVASDRAGCEFPYDNLYAYLLHRRLDHLLPMVGWGRPGELEQAAKIRRSKNFINVLKIRLNFYFPERCGAIARNEAHVRLMSSTWYMARKLRWPALVALAVSGVGIWVGFRYDFAESDPALFAFVASSAVFAIVVAVAAWLAIRSIEKFLHYQRVREVVWVLETAYTAFRHSPELLNDICREFGNAEKEAVPADAVTAGKLVG